MMTVKWMPLGKEPFNSGTENKKSISIKEKYGAWKLQFKVKCFQLSGSALNGLSLLLCCFDLLASIEMIWPHWRVG